MGSVIAFFLGVGNFIKNIPLKVWGVIAGVIVLILCVVWVEDKITDHQEYVSGLEQSNRDLTGVRDRLNARVNELSGINASNKATYDTSLQQAQEARRIAEVERSQALARADYYRSIRNAATNTPEAERLPVDPVILDTIDSLWDDSASD